MSFFVASTKSMISSNLIHFFSKERFLCYVNNPPLPGTKFLVLDGY